MDLHRHLRSLTLIAFILATFFSTALTRHSRAQHHHDRFKRQNGAGLYLPETYVTDADGELEAGPWQAWSSPSECSRTCGGGVATQRRACAPGHSCTGATSKYFSCNTQDCPDTNDYRTIQCAAYNRVPFDGTYYDWIPYTKAPNKCELNCMPRGERFYYRHNLTVVDGTPCSFEKLDVCVEGKCQKVGCDRMLGSNAEEDSCRQCGGDGTSCNNVRGLLNMQDLQVGYNDILLVPAGATNIIVKEIHPSNNYIAVRNITGHYYLNGNWRIDFPKSLRFAGTLFHYERNPQGFAAPDTISCLGPTIEPIYIVLLYQDRNVGVEYEYSVPKNISQNADPDTYSWTFDQFSACSATCGGGYQTRNVHCAGRRNLDPVDETLCDATIRPAANQTCGSEPCAPMWVEKEWSECSAICGDSGVQTVEIHCTRIISNGESTTVDDQQCIDTIGAKPAAEQECNRDVPCPKWHTGPWKPCDHLCGKGNKTRAVKCFRKEESGRIVVLEDSDCETSPSGKRPISEEPCEVRPCEGLDWITTEWSGCDEKCGPSKETRKATCATQKGEVYPDNLCEAHNKPELQRDCTVSINCEFQWFASQWSECSAKCGDGLQTRAVFCGVVEDTGVSKVDEGKCNKDIKYNNEKNCTSKVEKCPGEWFGGPWSKCTKKCGGGVTTRKVVCLAEDRTVDDKQCDSTLVPYSNNPCNEFSCGPDEIIPVEVTKPGSDVEDSDEPAEDSEEEEDEECEEGEDEEDIDASTVDFLSTDSSIVMITGSSDTKAADDDSTQVTPSVADFSLTSEDLMLSDGTGITDDDMETQTTISETETSDDGSSTDLDELGSGETPDATSEDSLSTDIPVTTPGLESDSGSSVDSESSSTSGRSSTTDGIASSVDTSPETTTNPSISSDISDKPTTTDITATESASESSTGISEDASEKTSSDVDSSDSTTPASESSDDLSSTTDSESLNSTDTDIKETSGSDSEATTIEVSDASTMPSSDLSPSVSSEAPSSSSTDDTMESSSSSFTTEISTESTIEDENSTTTDISSTMSSVDSSPDSSSTSDVSSMSSFDLTSGSVSTDSEESSSTISITTSESLTSDAAESTIEEDDYTAPVEVDPGRPKSRTTTSEAPSSVNAATISEEPITSTVESATTNIAESSTSSDLEEGYSTTVPVESTVIPTFSSEGLEISSVESKSESVVTTTPSSSDTSTDASTDGTSDIITDVSTEISKEMSIGVSSETSIDVTTEGSTEVAKGVSTLITETEVETSTPTAVDTTTLFTGESSSQISSVTAASIAASKQTTIHPAVVLLTKKPKKMCKRKKKSCKKTEFGCCSDKTTPAKGPFDKGCPAPKTCKESKYQCCPDGVSAAKGPKNEGCPPSQCAETLFGCCPDNTTVAEGNENEGCIQDPPPPQCTSSEFGCCPDNSTEAAGPGNAGCPEDCFKTEFGCCSDNKTAASGKFEEGCEQEPTMEPDQLPCVNTTYGCCPDGGSAATGENFEGCGVINHENCSMSYYGCCPDEKTPALGPQREGCKLPCDDEPFGCCPDLITPAHGPNQEGCCLQSEFGCCSDNVVPARGPDMEGCECEYSRYGCCADNITAAIGRDQEGCSCKHTPHGCCPNDHHTAKGPDFEGCPCHSYQFGCCDDGVTVAKGPRKQGCGCAYTEFKCCSDGKKAATGPNFEGCDCASSKYGCCPDGSSEAQGEKFHGCDDIPIIPQNACSQAKDRGSCRNYTVKWFYDMEYGGCSRFWYGGCDGNDNRFMSKEECKDVCVSPPEKDVCLLPKVAGPCEGYYPNWYYDGEAKHCAQFIYGGCLGNDNRFKTREECNSLCAIKETIDVCDQPRDEGPCRGSYARWVFNKETKSCERFRYGGCQGNDNNFHSEESCEQKCVHPGEPKDVCQLPKEAGNCTENVARWYFDSSSNKCLPFYFTGCNGNDNSFADRKSCEEDCPLKIELAECALPAEIGACHDYKNKWYFDTKVRRCRQFYYGGCGGNANRFESEAECERHCDSKTTPSPPTTTTTPTPAPAPREPFNSESCFLPTDPGRCRVATRRWFYNSSIGACGEFLYGGCEGNANNFETSEECQRSCGQAQDVCSLPNMQEHCDSEQQQWYYDSSADRCESFSRGGCRFDNQEDCEQRCRKSPPPTDLRTERPAVLRTRPPPVQQRPGQTKAPHEVCYMPVQSGDCKENISAWFYNPSLQKCDSFVYSGCGGNDNKFTSEEHCERTCGRFRGQDVCRYPRDPGPCRAAFPKYYFEESTRTCEEFIYGGCQGTGNRFSTIEECESICLAPREVPQPEPRPATNSSAHAICRMPVAQGTCGGGQKRWFFDDGRGSCVSFIYSGCGGNSNRFKTFQACVDFCSHILHEPPPEEYEPQVLTTHSPCISQQRQCRSLRCPYGIERRIDEEDCETCQCHNPCGDVECPEGSQCAVDLRMIDGATKYYPQCRQENKPGECPRLATESSTCERQCSTDADCPSDDKCCVTGCGSSCISPVPPESAIATTQALPGYTERPVVSGVQPPTFDETETDIKAEEGHYATLRCEARGYPTPSISWRRGNVVFERSKGRYRILNDGALQIVGLYPTDGGIYICVANNGVSHPVQKEYKLDVIAPSPHEALVITEENTEHIVNLGEQATLYCYAIGWPRPTITWWRGDDILPMTSDEYEQQRDNVLLVRSVTFSQLGIYTCQAYNGIGKATSWSTTLRAVPAKPQRRPNVRPPPAATDPNPEIIPPTRPPAPRIYTVPVNVTIPAPQTHYPVGGEISLPCIVAGHPRPRVQWYKDGRRIEQTNRINVTENNRLIIGDSKLSDSGEYTCEANNGYSNHSASVHISVEGIYVHPRCTDNPFFANCQLIVKEKFCTHKYYALFCCKSCTQAGQLPSHGPHLRQTPTKDNTEDNLV